MQPILATHSCKEQCCRLHATDHFNQISGEYAIVISEQYRLLYRSRSDIEASSCRGLEKTKEHVVFREVEHLTQGKTFADVKDLVETTYAHIDELSIFERISIEVDASDEVTYCSYVWKSTSWRALIVISRLEAQTSSI